MSLPNLDTASRQSSNSSNGFWEIGNYKANVQRIVQGSGQLDELCRFIKERVAIENNYSKHLERWNDEWSHYSAKHFSPGTSKMCLDLVLEEGKELSKVHSAVKDRFVDEVLKTIELFKKDNYHRSTFRGFREAKEVEEEFEKAQKQWKKLFERVESAKRAFHSATRAEKSAYIQSMNSKADSHNGSMADGASERAKERHEKCQEETRRARNSYVKLVDESRAYNGVYMENMAFVFEKCQQFEMKRLRFFLEMLSGVQKILVDLVNPPKLVQLHAKLNHRFQATTDANIGEDLKQWSQLHGVDCPIKWPVFEEYSAELRHISSSSAKTGRGKKGQQQEGGGGTGVVLTRRVEKGEDEAPAPMNGRNRQHPHRKMMHDDGHQQNQQQHGDGGMEPPMAEETQFDGKQNSIDSQQSRTTSRSSRSQSEKPQRNNNNVEMVQQQRHHHQPQQRTTLLMGHPANNNIRSATAADPLATDPFPMITPQKKATTPTSTNEEAAGGSERSFATNKTGSSAAFVRPDFALAASSIGGGGADKAHQLGDITANGRNNAQQNISLPQHQRNNNNNNIGVGAVGSTSSQSVPVISAKTTTTTNGTSGAQQQKQQQQQQLEDDEDRILAQLPPPLPVGPARVLFDYKPIEDDEIELIKGDVLDILSGPDHLGWCLGVKKTGKRGLFPAAYVAPMISHN